MNKLLEEMIIKNALEDLIFKCERLALTVHDDHTPQNLRKLIISEVDRSHEPGPVEGRCWS